MSTLFTPLTIGNGRIQVQHRVVMASMTRNRGVLHKDGIWLADGVVAQYYAQRASPGGLLITVGIPPSLVAAGMSNVPGLFDPAQHAGWKQVVDAVHARSGFVYAQLWHAGRVTIPHFTGGPGTNVSASSVPWENPDETYPFRTPDKQKIKYRDLPLTAMTDAQICQTTAVEAVGGLGNVGVRLEPTGLYQITRGDERVETWSYLCRQLAEKCGGSNDKLSYVHSIEPRFDRIDADEATAAAFRKSWSSSSPETPICNEPFWAILAAAGIPCIVCGGGWTTAEEADKALTKEGGLRPPLLARL